MIFVALAMSVVLSEAPIASEADRVTPDEQRVYAMVGTAGVGVGALAATNENRFRVFELYGAFNDATVEGRYSESWVFFRHNTFDWTFHANGSLRCAVEGAFDCGISPIAGLSAGWGGKNWDVFFGASTGAEYFFVETGVRFPERLSVGTRWHIGHVVLGITARGGVDLERGLKPAERADIVVDVGVGR